MRKSLQAKLYSFLSHVRKNMHLHRPRSIYDNDPFLERTSQISLCKFVFTNAIGAIECVNIHPPNILKREYFALYVS